MLLTGTRLDTSSVMINTDPYDMMLIHDAQPVARATSCQKKVCETDSKY